MIEIKRNRNNEKLIKAVNSLQLEFPVAEISERLKVDKGNLSSYLNNKKSVSSKFLEKFAAEFNIDFNEFETTNSDDDYEELEKEPTGYYYPEVSAAAGMDKEMQNEDLKRIPVTIPGWDKEISFINVYGDSMYPKYNAGEIIGVKIIEFQYLNYGYPYVVVLNNGDTYIKIVQPGSDNEHLLLVSINEFYKPKEFHLSLIKSFYSIKGVIKKEMM